MIIKLPKRPGGVRSGGAHVGCLKRKLHASKRGAQGTRRDSELSSTEVLHSKGNFPTSPRVRGLRQRIGRITKTIASLGPGTGNQRVHRIG